MGPSGEIPPEQWSVYSRVIQTARREGVPFAIGGAFAFGAYTGLWHNTKDLDLYVLPRDRDAMIGVLVRNGLSDYYSRLPYDRRWIYRGVANGTIVDVIWSMANQRAQVDETWIAGGREVTLNGESVRAIPAEELIWAKMYVLQRERCDWPDVLNVIYAAGPGLNWAHLLDRLGEDWDVLKSLLVLFSWLAPGRACALPAWLWERLELKIPAPGAEDVDQRRVALLDTRPWFGRR
ncbi:MAG TPA: hypothetical protein PLP04_17610 [Bryobacteraceae bacterium]|nr:hypothetical protein [Bryobacteraceae bacterium]HPQ17052.1 hypothetical protein [Bryobacteraceae bacterium]